MANDAMDWNPTTPPSAHNPYSHPFYVPGGWPESPPPFRYTSGVFAKKRQCNFAERAAKRVCVGAWMLGSYTLTYPVRPVCGIVRDWKRRRQQQSRVSPRRNRAQLRSIPPLLDEIVCAAEEQERAEQAAQSQPHQIASPPVTPTHTEHKTKARKQVHQRKEIFENPAATSVTDTETSLWTPTTPRHSTKQHIATNQTAKPRTSKQQQLYEATDKTVHYPKLQAYCNTIHEVQLLVPDPDMSPEAKNIPTYNRFDAGYRRKPRAHGSQGLAPGYRLKAIGARVQNSDKANDFWGGWEHEKPIEPASFPTPSDQMHSELRSHASNHASDNIPKNLEAPQTEAKTEGMSSAESLQHDERWSSVPLVEAHLPDNSSESAEPSKEDSNSVPQRLFHDNHAVLTPPPVVRKRHMILADPPDETKNELLTERTRKTDDKVCEHQETSADVVPVEQDLINQPSDSGKMIVTNDKKSANDQIELEPLANNAILNGEPVAVPVTPMKVLAEKPAQHDLETSMSKSMRNSFETPAQEFSKLKIAEQGDNDTPKATPHSGTKTTRITRYREALEKAQKAKLQQYELVPISDEWDQKVRKAIRNGIPGYLGPHDLARLCPQYATRGQDNWLNDETINKYLELVAAHGRRDDRPDQVRSHHAFNNFFYNNLRSKGPESVLRWAKKAKIGGTSLAYVEKVFVPINSGAHWTLAVVEPTQKKITHYNSMQGAGTGMRACEDLKKWVALEQGKTFREEEWTLTAVGESPQQTNSDDCGVFTITSARQIMLGYTPMSYGPTQIPVQRIRIVAELINQGLLRSSSED